MNNTLVYAYVYKLMCICTSMCIYAHIYLSLYILTYMTYQVFLHVQPLNFHKNPVEHFPYRAEATETLRTQIIYKLVRDRAGNQLQSCF